MKHFLMIIGCLFAFSVMGQKEVVSAYNANKDGDYRAASTYIEQAILVEKSKTKDKTWRYRGEIYLNISRDTTLDIEYPNALRLAMESYLKAQEFDIKERYVDEIRLGLAQVHEFDSSYKRGEPISFPLNGVIPGWTEGLQLMKVGGKTTFYIPQELAYGARPNPGGPIPPYAALIFEVELLGIEAAE